MALSYLSGIDIGKSKKKSEKKTKKKEKRKEKVAKVGLAPSRAAFLTAVTLNLLKLGTKLARVYNSPGGKEKLDAWWKKFGGDFNKLKEAISKGSKTKISGAKVGIAVEVVLATALPICIAVVPLIKAFKAGGDATEQSEFDMGLNGAEQEMGSNPEFTKGNTYVPVGDKVVAVKYGSKGKGGGGGDGDGELGSFFSPIGFYFMGSFQLMALNMNLGPVPGTILYVLLGIIGSYFTLGTIAGIIYTFVVPNRETWLKKFVFAPFVLLNYFRYGKEGKN
jgi:hypothetical protein